MNNPSIEEGVGSIIYTFDDLNLKVVAERISEEGIAELWFYSVNSNKQEKLLHTTRVNLMSTTTMTSLTKRMKEHSDKIAWSDILTYITGKTLEITRKEEPTRELWTHEDIAAPEFLLEPILYKGLTTTIFGEKTACKSTLALFIYTCLILPWHDNPFNWITPQHSVKTLILDYEVDFGIAQHNAKKIQEGMGLPPFPIYYRRCSAPLADTINQIQKHAAILGAEVIIVDSLGPAVGGDLMKPSDALRFTSALRQLKCASLIIAQTSKEKESKHKTIFGSVFFEYYSRNIFELRKVDEEGEDTVDIALYHRYCNLGKKLPAKGFTLTFNDNATTMRTSQITARELIARLSTQARILFQLKSGTLTAKEIMDELEITRGNADASLKRLKDKNKIVKVGDKWGLLSDQKLL